jgi:hypothetical protein
MLFDSSLRADGLYGTPSMHVIEHTYVSLLADVANQTGFSEIRGSYFGLQWCLIMGPKLEKQILEAVETGESLDLSEFPRSLHRLALASLVDAKAMRAIRQLLLFCYKASVTYDNTSVEKAFKSFLDTNLSVNRFSNSLARESPRLLDRVRLLVQPVLHRAFSKTAFRPSHGPGAVTTSKRKWEDWYSTIEYVYPYSDHLCLYFNQAHCEQLDECTRTDIIESKVIAVPKDSRGPRLICVHPAEAIWVQQAVRRNLERAISSPRPPDSGLWPRGRIWFQDQTVNGRIALLSSRSRRYATLDMKEASDRISDCLVQILFGKMYKYFGCCRAQKFVIPKLGSFVNLRGDIHSYAPMGNATTFPVQSLVFWAICVASLQRQGFHQPGAVFVFGDDIEVPSECAQGVVDDLESFGLLVNRTKSFWRGAFRESCGVDAFNGVNVTPVRWKTTLDAEHPTGLQSLSDLAMRLRIAGYEEAAVTTYQTLRRRLRSRYGKQLFTTNNLYHGGIAEYTMNEPQVWYDAFWHRDYQWYHSPVWRLEDIKESPDVHDWNHVLESVCSLERTSRGRAREDTTQSELASRRVRLQRGWIRVA